MTHPTIPPCRCGAEVRSHRADVVIWACGRCRIGDLEQTPCPVPATPLAARLLELRGRVVASGEPLLSWDEIEEETR